MIIYKIIICEYVNYNYFENLNNVHIAYYYHGFNLCYLLYKCITRTCKAEGKPVKDL